MFERLIRGWALTKQSAAVLVSDKKLVVFPLLSSISLLGLLLSFVIPAALTFGGDDGLAGRGAHGIEARPAHWAGVFVFYFLSYLVIAFFNAALVFCAMRRFEGEEARIGEGLAAAVGRLPQILGWCAVSATVGMVLRALSERSGAIGRVVVGLLGVAWSIAIYFAVPILVVEGLGPIAVIRRSAELVKKTWGESLTGHATVSVVSSLFVLLSLSPLLAGLALSGSIGSLAPLLVGGGLTALMLLATGLVFSALNTIVLVATYRFAAGSGVPSAFDGDLLRQAFRTRL